MAKVSMALAELVEKGAQDDVVRELLGYVAERLMEFEIEQRTGVEYGARSSERANSRNDYRDRLWETRAGSIDLRIPKLRKALTFPRFWKRVGPRRKRSLQLFKKRTSKASPRAVDVLVQAMGMTGISKSQVSRLCSELDERVNAFLDRPIEGDWPYLRIDATYVKVRQAGRIVSVAVIIAVGVNTDGIGEILGVAIGPSEAEPFWADFLRSLTRRGLRGVKLVISDSHLGLKAANRESIQSDVAALSRSLRAQCAGVRWQRPTVNCSRAHQHRLRARRCERCTRAVGDRRRSTAREMAKACSDDGKLSRRGPRIHDVPQSASHAEHRRIPWNESMLRSSAGPMSSASFQTIPRLCDSLARCSSSRTTNGNCSGATCSSKD